MKGRATKPAAGPLRCVECSTPLAIISLKDETFAFSYQANACPACGKQALTLAQLDAYNVLRDEARGTLQSRKIQRFGNSLGLTLPASVRDLVQEGMRVEVHVLNPKTFQIKVVGDRPLKKSPRRQAKHAA